MPLYIRTGASSSITRQYCTVMPPHVVPLNICCNILIGVCFLNYHMYTSIRFPKFHFFTQFFQTKMTNKIGGVWKRFSRCWTLHNCVV